MLISRYYILNKDLNLFFAKNHNCFFLYGLLGTSFFFLPSYYFYKIFCTNITFIFLKVFFFRSFISHFSYKYISLNYLYFIRIKMRGLGYEIEKLTKNIFSFCFFFINFFYLYLPLNIMSRWRKKRVIFISNNLEILTLVWKNILLLKKIGPYRRLGINNPRQILILKKKIKKRK